MSALQESLLELGFTANDAVVYLALVQHGPCNAGPIIQATDFHRNIVYSSIQHLEARKLVMEKIVNGRKIFSVTSPQSLTDEFERKAELAKKLTNQIKKLADSGSEEIVIYEGRKQYIDLLSGLLEAMPPNSIEYIFGTGNGQLMSKYIKAFNKDYLKRLQEAKGRVRIIAYRRDKEVLENDLKRLPRERYQVRYLDDDLPDPYVLDVYPHLNIVLQNIYSEDGQSVTAIKVMNKHYTRACLRLCEKLWERGRK